MKAKAHFPGRGIDTRRLHQKKMKSTGKNKKAALIRRRDKKMTKTQAYQERYSTMSRYNANNLDVSNPAPRCPVVLLLDTSSSMEGAPINELNKGLKQFIQETSSDEAASRSVEVEIITFDWNAEVVTPFTSISKMNRNQRPLVAEGATSMGAGIRLALRDLKARRKMYRDNGISCYRPWVILMTDGELNDDNWEEAAEEMRALGEHGKIQYIGIEIGDDVDHDTMCRILPAVPGPVKLKGLRFRQFFRWLTDSMKSVSASAVSEQDNVYFREITDWGDL